MDAVRAVEGVRVAQGVLERTVNLPIDFNDRDPRSADAVVMLNLVGLDPDAARDVRAYVIRDGRFLEPGDAGAAVITASLADDLGVTLGGSFALPTAVGVVNLTVVGLRAPRALPGNEEVLVPLAEAILLAALGCVFGLAAGLYLGYLLVKAMAAAGFPAPYVFPWGGLASAVIIGLAFGALASIVPARKASGLQIVEALRYE